MGLAAVAMLQVYGVARGPERGYPHPSASGLEGLVQSITNGIEAASTSPRAGSSALPAWDVNDGCTDTISFRRHGY